VLRWIYRVHKWVGVGIGLVLIMWIVTGVLLSTAEGRGAGRGAPPPAYASATIAPAQAVAEATSGDSALAGVRSVELDRLGDRVIYRVTGAPRGTVLIDGTTGQRIAITDRLAATLGAQAVPGVQVESTELIHRNDRGYSGSLPAWRVKFGDAEGTWFQVGVPDGVELISTAASRRSSTLHGLHTFASLKALHLERRQIRLLLIGASAVAAAGVLTGYILSLPRRRRA